MKKKKISEKERQSIIKAVQEKVSNVSKEDINKILKKFISIGSGVLVIAQTVNKIIEEINKNKKPL